MPEPKTKLAPAPKARARKAAVPRKPKTAPALEVASPDLPRGRTAALEPAEADELFHNGVALFNGVRYWHAHEAWETLWRAAPDRERDFYQGLIQVAAGLLHLQRRNVRGARNKLAEGLARLRPYQPTYRGIFVNELVGKAERMLEDLDQGLVPYLIPPVIRYTEARHVAEDFDR